MLCSGLLTCLSKLMRVANCVRFCLNHEGCLSCNKNDSDKMVHNSQLTSAGIRSRKTRVEHYILILLLFYTIKEIFLVLGAFSDSIYRARSSVHEKEVSYLCTIQVLLNDYFQTTTSGVV